MLCTSVGIKFKNMSFQDSEVNNILISRLKVLRDRDLLTDVVLATENEEFKAHKIILCCFSEYFCALFTDPMIESKASKICLSMLTANGLRTILDYIYTSEINVSVENVVDVIQAATYLQIDSAVVYCDFFLRKNLSDDNVIDVITVGELYSLVDLTRYAHTYLSGNLSKVFANHREDIEKLSVAQIKYFLDSDLVTDCLEETILEFVLAWFLSGSAKEMECKETKADDVLRSIRYTNIPNKQLYEVIRKTFPEEKTRKSHVLYKMILEKKFVSESECKSGKVDACSRNVRGMQKAFLLVGGISSMGITNDVSYRFVEDGSKWETLTAIPHIDQCNYGTAVHKNILYVFGGCYNVYDEEILHPYAFGFDPLTSQWKTLCAMRQGRCRFSLTSVPEQNSLYAIGGCVDSDASSYTLDEGSNLCDRYMVSTNTWEAVCSLPKSICRHAACTLKVGNEERLFVSGGLHNVYGSSHVFEYEPRADEWRRRASLLAPRVDHSMFTYKGKLYVCGGWNYRPDNSRVLIESIDEYDPERDSWRTVARKERPTYHSAHVMHEGRIYFVGGFCDLSQFHKTFQRLDCYDVDADRWTVADERPQEIWEHCCVTMFVPKNWRLYARQAL